VNTSNTWTFFSQSIYIGTFQHGINISRMWKFIYSEPSYQTNLATNRNQHRHDHLWDLEEDWNVDHRSVQSVQLESKWICIVMSNAHQRALQNRLLWSCCCLINPDQSQTTNIQPNEHKLNENTHQ
jgi:hypothetical protein